MTAPYIVELYARGTNLPGYINDYFPEINQKYENGRIYVKHLPGGQITILIMGDTNDELLNTINHLPDNYFADK